MGKYTIAYYFCCQLFFVPFVTRVASLNFPSFCLPVTIRRCISPIHNRRRRTLCDGTYGRAEESNHLLALYRKLQLRRITNRGHHKTEYRNSDRIANNGPNVERVGEKCAQEIVPQSMLGTPLVPCYRDFVNKITAAAAKL